jgi:hypothetical protein
MIIKTVIALVVIVTAVSGASAAERQRSQYPAWQTYDDSLYFGREWKRQGGPKHGMCGCGGD